MATVVLVVLALAVGLAAGFARRGRLSRLGTPQPVRNRLLLTALGLYVVAVFASWAWDSALAVISALSWFVVAFYAWVNRWMPGARLVALGVAANALVLILNGGVPISRDAADRAGADRETLSAHYARVVDDSTQLSWLAKNIPVAFPPRPEVVSPGDVAIAAGLATALWTGMTGRWPGSNVIASTHRRYRYADQYVSDYLPDDDATDDANLSAEEGVAAHSAGATATDDEPGQPSAHATIERRPDSDTAPIRGQENSA